MKRLHLPPHTSLTQQLREAARANAARDGACWDLRERTSPWVWSHRTQRGGGGDHITAGECEDTEKFPVGAAHEAARDS